MASFRICLIVFLFLFNQRLVLAQDLVKMNKSVQPTNSLVLKEKLDLLNRQVDNLNEEALQVKNSLGSLQQEFDLSPLVQGALLGEDNDAKELKKTPLSFEYVTLKKASKPIITSEGDTLISTIEFTYPLFNNPEWDEVVRGIYNSSEEEDFSSVEDYMDNFIALSDEMNSDVDFASAWFQEVVISVEPQLEGAQTISFSNSWYEYSGGAHPNSYLTYSNHDVLNKQVIELEDLLVPGAMAKLTAVGNTIFRKQEGLTPTQSLENYSFENNKFSLNTNFLITEEGLMFFYNTYEIRSYAEGPMELLLPYASLKGILKPNPFLPVAW